MANVKESGLGEGSPTAGGGGSKSTTPAKGSSREKQNGAPNVEELIAALQRDQYKGEAIELLLKSRGACADLALLLWDSFNTIFTLLQEVIATYPFLSSPNFLPESTRIRVCNALALLQCVACHSETKKKFIRANIPLYLYPFLWTTSSDTNIEYLRLTSLGVIGALVKLIFQVDDAEVTHFLLKSEIFPYCLRCMEVGNDLSKTVATFIIYRILMHDEGLKYCCCSAERFYAVSHVLGNMVESSLEDPSPRLLKHIILCYCRLSDSPRACDGLRCSLPPRLKNNSLVGLLREDPAIVEQLQKLFYNVATGHRPNPQSVGDVYQHMHIG